MPNPDQEVAATQSWSDPRYFLNTYIVPFGFFVWLGGTIGAIVFSVNYIMTIHGGIANKIGNVIISIFVFFASLYYCIGLFQVFFLELKERFIAHKVIYRDGMFLLKGYYFKKAAFKADEVVKLEPIVVSERWFQRRLGTLLSRSTRFTIPSGKNVNWKVVLRDGREYFLPGEMGRPGLWKAGDLDELRALLESGIPPA